MPLLGREPELSAIDGMLAGLADRGGSLVIRGDAGLGKSALLEEAEARARALDVGVLRTAGVASEAGMAFAGLHRLLRPRLPKLAELPDPQAAALASAFGIADGAAPDTFLIALAALDLLADAAAESPLLVIVEDAHLLDADTSDVLAFVARRLDLEPIAMLFAIRDGHRSRLEDAGLPELALRGLDDDDAQRLLDTHGPDLAPEVRRRVLETAGGNPLALLELPRALTHRASSHEPVPLTDAIREAFSDRVSALPPSSRTLLLVAALDEQAPLKEVLKAASLLQQEPVDAGALEPAEARGLVRLTDARIEFRHPLVPAAIEQSAPTPTRRAAHAALALVYVSDPDRHAWHRAAACTGPDADAAAGLEAAAGRAMSRGAPAVAAAALERAAELTPDPEARGKLLLHAAEMEFELGRPDLALRLLERAKPLVPGGRDRARLALLFEAADEDSWSGPDRVARFAAFASAMPGAEAPERALFALLTVARGCWWGNPTQDTRDLVVAAAERLEVPEDSPARLLILGCADPVRRGAYVLERVERIAPDDGEDPAALHMIGTAATAVLAFDTSLPFLAAALDGLRAQGRLGSLAQALVSQAWAALHVANGTLASSAAAEAAQLARETGQLRWAVAADLVRATLAGERGDFDTSAALSRQAEAELLPIGAKPLLSLVQFARGRGAVAHQQYADGYDQMSRILDPGDVAHHPFVGAWALADLIEAAFHCDRINEATRHLAHLETLTSATSSSYLRASLAYVRPLVADDERAGELFEAGLDGELSSWPCFRARLLLAYGRWLRRRRRVADSRAPLRAAKESADALGFDGLAEHARQELRASGETARRRVPDARDQLTPQELQIAQLAAAGLSNREIGQRLYLSHRTVGSHLYRIFPKLGVTSRVQIAEALHQGARHVA
jgi:DNA-binding CsgD family transcriptional regulator/tetratricopeptide (TPR) repeat protein